MTLVTLIVPASVISESSTSPVSGSTSSLYASDSELSSNLNPLTTAAVDDYVVSFHKNHSSFPRNPFKLLNKKHYCLPDRILQGLSHIIFLLSADIAAESAQSAPVVTDAKRLFSRIADNIL